MIRTLGKAACVAFAALAVVTAAACGDDGRAGTNEAASAEDDPGTHDVTHWTVAGDAVEMLAAGDGLVLVYGSATSLVDLRTGDVIAEETIDGLDGPPEMDDAVEQFRVGDRDVLVRAEDRRIVAGRQDEPPLLKSAPGESFGPLPAVHIGPYSVENSLDGAVIRHEDGTEWRFPVYDPQFDERVIAVDGWVVLGMSEGTVLAIDLATRDGIEAAAAEWAEANPAPPPPPMDGGPEAVALVTAAASEYVDAIHALDLERMSSVVSAECWPTVRERLERGIAESTPEELAEITDGTVPVPEVVSIEGHVATVAIDPFGEVPFVLMDGAWVVHSDRC